MWQYYTITIRHVQLDIGTVTRVQKDINNKTLCNAQQSETLFFKNHATYRSIAHNYGTPYVSYKLNHIKKCLPGSIQDLKQGIASYGTLITMDNDINNNKCALSLHLGSFRQITCAVAIQCIVIK
eukprot:220963_1